MKVSVALTVYNGENFLIEQLDSIRLQTYKVDEVIICDDRSSDNSYELVRSYIDKYQLGANWKLYLNEHNLGYANNFKEAVKKTNGDLIFFCDQDDIWINDRVERMVDIMERNPQIQLLGSEFEPFTCTDDAPRIAKSVMKKMVNNGSLEHIRLNHKTIFIGSEGCTMCVRRSLFEKTQKYWFTGWAHDEYVWKMALCMDGCYIYHFKSLKRRLHSSNVSKRKMRNLEKRINFLMDLEKSHNRMLLFAVDTHINGSSIKLINKNIKSVQLRIDMLRNKKVMHIFSLIFKYINNYHSRKSIPVELIMALKRQ